MTPWDQLLSHSRVTCPEGGWRPEAIQTGIDDALGESDVVEKRTLLGQSFEGRPITLLELGTGPRRVLLWSQMHGDEPTHTTALLNLLGLLARGDEPAATILSGLTLGVITPLNPDGAERCTRQNAQGIDVNRDALAFATSEGRALRDAVTHFAPHYGFNLHNQPYRRGVGSPLEPVVVTLLVPPVDEDNTQTDSVREATRVAAFFAEAAGPHCGGRLSRYQIDYMARAFGEWVQRQGVAALLVEASGWPGGDFEEMERLHFAALVQTLEAIAQCGLGDDSALAGADPRSYLDLPKSITQGVHDLLIAPRGVAQSATGELTTAGVAIDFPNRNSANRGRADGIVCDFGDLRESEGLDRIDAPEAVVLPGRIAFAPPLDPSDPRGPFAVPNMTSQGVTTVLLQFDLALDDLEERLENITKSELSLNAALVGVAEGEVEDLETRIVVAASSGLAAVVIPGITARVAKLCERLSVPVLDPAEIPTAESIPATQGAWVEETQAIAERLGWSDRGRVALEGPADLVLATTDGDHIKEVRNVYVGGAVVYGDGAPRGAVGRWLG